MTPEAASSLPFSPDALVMLVEDLRRAGYNVGISEYIAAQDLLVALAARGRLPAEPDRFRTLLAPLLANSATEQADFGGHFDRWLGQLQERRAEAAAEARSSSDEERRKELDRIARGNRRWAVVRVLAVAMLVFGAVALVSYFTFTWTGTATPDFTGTPPLVEAPPQQPGRLSPWLALPFLLPLALFIVYRAWWHRRADQFLDRRTTDETASVRPLFVTGRASQLFHTIPLLRAARSLRKHEMVDSPDLDVEATVDATVRRGGYFDPILRKRPRLPEYLALVDRAGPRDQRAQLVDALLDGLQQEGLFISRYYFHDDPRLCFPPTMSEQPMRLDYLAAQYSGHRLWIFTEGDGFIDPFTGATPRWVEQFEAWSSRTVFTFEATANWGSREGALANAGFRVLPASETGLADSADPTLLRRETTNLADLPPLVPALLTEDPRRWTGPDPPDAGLMEQCLAEVSDYLGEERYGWLAACAVYPDLRWELTLFLGHRLEQANGAGTCLLSLEHVAALVRLPWFRAGFLPDWLRRRLVDDLSATSDRTVRRALGELLLSSLDGPVDAFALEIAQTNTRTVDQLWRRAVRRWRREEESGGVLHDRVFLTHMNSSLALQVPRQVGRLLRSAGRRLAHSSPAMGALAPRRLWEAWAAAAAMGVTVSAMASPIFYADEGLTYVWVCSIALAFLTGLILAASSRHRLRFGYARLVGELTILITLGILGAYLPIGISEIGAGVLLVIGQFVLHGAGELPPGFLAVAAVLGLPYFWLIRQHRLRSRWDRWIDPIGRAVDAWLPDRILRRLLTRRTGRTLPRTRTAQQDEAIDPSAAPTVPRMLRLSTIVHLAIVLPVMIGTWNSQIWHETLWVGGPILAANGLVMTWLSRGVSRRGVAVGLSSSLLLMGALVAVAAGSSAARFEVALVVNGYGVATMLSLIELLGISIRTLVLVHAAGVLLAVCMAWLEHLTIVFSGISLSLTGGWLAWRSRHTSRWAVAAGLSTFGMSLVCFSLITANGWGPSDAYLPISIMLTIYLVAFIGLVGMYFRDARKKRN